MHQIRLRLGLSQTPSWIWGPLRGRRRGWAEEEEGRGEEGELEGREREGPQVTVEPGPLRALLRHWVPLTLLVGRLEGHPVCKKLVVWFVGGGDLTGALRVLELQLSLLAASVIFISNKIENKIRLCTSLPTRLTQQ